MKYLLSTLIVLFFFSSCIEKYFEYGEEDDKFIVVDAMISDKNEKQKILLSESVFVEYSNFNPISGCVVTVYDQYMNAFVFTESDSLPGTYYGLIDTSNFYSKNKFKLYFRTYDGVEYESSYEEYIPTLEIDTLYYELKFNEYTNDETNYASDGVQFYMGLSKDDNYSNYSKYKLTETYEYHSTWPINEYWAGQMFHEFDYSKFTCYKTNEIRSIYLSDLSLLNNDANTIIPLNFVSDNSQRLFYKYSINVERYSLTEDAYVFWSKLQKNQHEGGGLFDSQPINVIGNIFCITKTNEKVLGYFGVSSFSSKRIFVSNVAQLGFEYENIFCVAMNIDGKSFASRVYGSAQQEWPIYIPPAPDDNSNDKFDFYIAPNDCFDCTLKGGTVDPPDFWQSNKKNSNE